MDRRSLENAITRRLLSKPHIKKTRALIEEQLATAIEAKDRLTITELLPLTEELADLEKKLNEPAPAQQTAAAPSKKAGEKFT